MDVHKCSLAAPTTKVFTLRPCNAKNIIKLHELQYFHDQVTSIH
jgi:hypothetical protein